MEILWLLLLLFWSGKSPMEVLFTLNSIGLQNRPTKVGEIM